MSLWNLTNPILCNWYVNSRYNEALLTYLCEAGRFSKRKHITDITSSLSENTPFRGHITNSSWSLLPLDSSIPSWSGNFVDTSSFDSDVPAKAPLEIAHDLNVIVNLPSNSTWFSPQVSLTSDRHGFDHGDTTSLRKSPTDTILNLDRIADSIYKDWQPDTVRYGLGAGDTTFYVSIFDEPNQLDIPMLADDITSPKSHLNSYPCSSQYLRLTKELPLRPTSHISCLDSVQEIPLSPVSSHETEPTGKSATTADTEHHLKKSQGRARILHSAVEKKYRTALKSRLAALRQCVPTLHAETEGEREQGGPNTTAGNQRKDVKLQKGLILSSAAEYIRILQTRKSQLETRIDLLERRLPILEKNALEKKNGVDSGLKTTDHKWKKAQVANKATHTLGGVVQTKIRAKRKPIGTPDRAGLGKSLQNDFDRYGGEPAGDLVTYNNPSSAKRRKFSREEFAKVAVCSPADLAPVGRLH
jgi:hypothetical protein